MPARQVATNLGRPRASAPAAFDAVRRYLARLFPSFPSDLALLYRWNRADAFRSQIAPAAAVIGGAMLLYEAASIVAPDLVGPIPPQSLLLALAAEALIAFMGERATQFGTIRLAALSVFLVPLALMLHHGMPAASFYLIITFVLGFVMPWNGIEAALVSLIPYASFIITGGRPPGILFDPIEVLSLLIATVIISSLQFRQEIERRRKFLIERQALDANQKVVESLGVAAKLHEEIITRDRDHRILTMRVLYEPMQQLGGDYVKVRRYSESRSVLLIADVTGHGVPAALMVNRVNTRVESIMGDRLDPVAAAWQLTGFTRQAFAGSGMLMSAVWADYDAQAGVMQWINFGHPPPVHIRRAHRSLEFLRSNAPLLGIETSQPIEARVQSVAAGDFFLFYTDGLLELMTAEGRLTEARLQALLGDILRAAEERQEVLTAEHFIRELRRMVRTLRVGEQLDDLLIIVWAILESPSVEIGEITP